MTAKECDCLEHGPRYPAVSYTALGRDETNLKFAEVELLTCTLCGRLWLKVLHEREYHSRSGRFAMALIDQARASKMSPSDAIAFIEAAPFYILGGSFYGHAGKKGHEALDWKYW